MKFNNMDLELIFKKLWKMYTSQNPAVQEVYDLFMAEGERVVNDHIAFRTFDDPRVSIDVLAKPFLTNGYIEKGTYHFEEKKLFARHFELPGNPEAPRVFISELMTGHFSKFLQETIQRVTGQIPGPLLSSEELIFSGRTWGKPSFEVYNKLKEESEYAAWVYVFGFCANHFTVSVNHLKKHDSIEKVNSLLKANGFLINDSGGEIKGTPKELLEQSSIKSGIISVEFTEGAFKIPGCYYEFARSYPDSNRAIVFRVYCQIGRQDFREHGFLPKA
jgi:hypothetical protein